MAAFIRASNWTCLGADSAKINFYQGQADGALIHSRSACLENRIQGCVRTFEGMVRCKSGIPIARKSLKVPGKHKYALALDKSLQPMLDAMAKPYPKRPKDSSEPPGDLPGEGGAAPTRTLH